MYNSSRWETNEDFERDLLLYAEYNASTSEQPKKGNHVKMPDTIAEYHKRMQKNKQSPLNSDIDDGLTFIVSGRGRGTKDRLLRPGVPLPIDLTDERELVRKIRAVSGLGYSNELIETSISRHPEMPSSSSNNTLVESGTLSSSSSNSSQTSSPRKMYKSNNKPRSTDLNDKNFPKLK